MESNIIYVVCLVIVDRKGFFYATKRPEGKSMAFHWEFPGGKVEPNENPEDALRREIEEELTWGVGALERFPDSVHEYAFGTICLTPYIHHCAARPELILTEHVDSRWINPSEWKELLWAPADIPIIKNLLKEAFLV